MGRSRSRGPTRGPLIDGSGTPRWAAAPDRRRRDRAPSILRSWVQSVCARPRAWGHPSPRSYCAEPEDDQTLLRRSPQGPDRSACMSLVGPPMAGARRRSRAPGRVGQVMDEPTEGVHPDLRYRALTVLRFTCPLMRAPRRVLRHWAGRPSLSCHAPIGPALH